MKKLILFTVFFFALYPVWQAGSWQLHSLTVLYAQTDFGNELPDVEICGYSIRERVTGGAFVCSVTVDCTTGGQLNKECQFVPDLGDADGDDGDGGGDDDGGSDSGGGSPDGTPTYTECTKVERTAGKNYDGITGTWVCTLTYTCELGPGNAVKTCVFETAPAPCGGNVVHNPTLTASSPGNFKGGTFGFTRKKEDGSPKHHDGIDITADPGSNVYTMYEGTITRINKNFAPDTYAENSFGNYVEIRSVINGQTVYLKYNHLDGVLSTLNVGDPIQKGTVMGISGTTGNASSKNPKRKTKITPHVHIQARNADWQKLDPALYMNTKFNTTTGQPINPCN